MNARWQQLLSLSMVLGFVAWGLWQWPQSPAVACLGWALALGVGLVWMGLPFVIMQRINRRDAAPRARLGQVVRAACREMGCAWRVFGWQQPFRSRAVADWLPAVQQQGDGGSAAAPRGVVLLHGYLCNRGYWNPWMQALRARGHAFAAPTLEPAFGSIDAYVAQIEAAVQQVQQATGRAPVLVCHSMGGLAARAWMRATPDADARVHRVITLGTPHSGTWLAQGSRTANGVQMQRGSAWLSALAAQEPPARAKRFVCWYSNCDNIVFPASTAQLAGADNRFVGGVAHLEMAFVPEVLQDCLALIAQD
jgi:triacylglycerol lipase